MSTGLDGQGNPSDRSWWKWEKMENGRFLRSLELRLPGTLFGGNQYAI